ncbi:MAG: alpha/beta fold hydrolase [Nitrospiraceae bacterium]|nr:MAG: alpha/beta fold hydrolase [Nitrospiraceae bacterium]
MNLDITVHKGEKDRPVVILIHGLSMDKNFWLDPLNTKMFARNVPLSVFTAKKPSPRKSIKGRKITLGEFPCNVENMWSLLQGAGYGLVCWSQRRPVGPILSAVEELAWIVKMTKEKFRGRPIVLIGHSRGGLIARKYMETKDPEIKALITISTPHAGSSIAKIGNYLEPFSAILRKISPESDHTVISRTVKNVKNLLEGKAWKDLMPGSVFFKNLNDTCLKGVYYVSFGGTQPRFFTLYFWKKKGDKIYAHPLLSIPDSLVKAVPPVLKIEEIMPGGGDGLVTLKSSEMPWSSDHYNVSANHVSVIWNKKTIDAVFRTLNSI